MARSSRTGRSSGSPRELLGRADEKRQRADANFYTGQSTGPNPIHNDNCLAYAPPCTTTNFAACYNPDAVDTTGILDVPNRVILAPIVELPFGRGQRYGGFNGVFNAIAGGWTISAAINRQQGFPIVVQQSDNANTLLLALHTAGTGATRPGPGRFFMRRRAPFSPVSTLPNIQ